MPDFQTHIVYVLSYLVMNLRLSSTSIDIYIYIYYIHKSNG